MAISARAAGAWEAVNDTTQTVTLPTHATGDLLLVFAARKPYTPDPTMSTTGWSRLYSYADGAVANGNGSGSVVQAVFWKVATSNAETNPVVTWNTTAAPGLAVAHSYQKGAGETWETPLFTNGNTTNDTSISVSVANPGIVSGGIGIVFHSTRDNSAITVPTFTQTGATLGTVAVYPATPITSATSNDMAATAAYRAITTAGSGNITLTGTQAAAETGVSSFIFINASSVTVVGGSLTADAVLAASNTYAQESFGGTSGSGWTKADSGDSWTVTEGSETDFTEGSGIGQIVVGGSWQGKQAILQAVQRTDTETSFRFRFDKLPAGTGASIAGFSQTRWDASTDTYAAGLVVTETGQLQVFIDRVSGGTPTGLLNVQVAGVTPAINTWYWVRYRIVGTDHSIRGWVDGAAEPSTWETVSDSTAGLQDAGSVGLGAFNSQFISNNPITFQFDDFLVTAPPASNTISGSFTANAILRRTVEGVSYDQMVANAGASAAFPLNDNADYPQDVIGTNHFTSKQGTPTYGATGPITTDTDNTSVTFSSANLQAPHNAAFDMGDFFTIAVWFKRAAINSLQVLVGKNTSSGEVNNPVLAIDATNKLVMYKAGVGQSVISTATVTDTTTWHFYVVTKNGASQAIWLDGVDVTGSITNLTMANNTANVNIGSDPGPSNVFAGSLARLAFYPSINLTSDQINALYARATTPAGITADAVLAASSGGTGSLTANAVLRRIESRTFSADSILRKTTSSALTSDGILRQTISTTWTADSILRATVAPTFTSNAVLRKLDNTAAFTADSIFRKIVAGTWTADAVLRKEASAGFTSDAVLLKTTAATLTVDAVLSASLTTVSGSFTANAIMFRQGTSTFGVDAILRTIVPSTFTADAVLRATYSANPTADAVLRKLDNASTFTANAYLLAVVAGTFTANAVLKATYSSTPTADAVLRATVAPTLTANAVLFKTTAGTFSADAVLRKVDNAGSFTGNAIVRRIESASVTADAWIRGVTSVTFTANAVLRKLDNTSTFTANATLRRVEAFTFTANAVLFKNAAGAFTSDAVTRRIESGTWTSDAVLRRSEAASATADAVLRRIESSTLTADAYYILRTNGTFTSNAILRSIVNSIFTSDGILRRIESATFTANAVLTNTTQSTFTANAVLRATISGSLTADALLRKVVSGTITADSILRRVESGTWTGDAIVRRIEARSVTSDAVLRQITETTFTANAYLLAVRASSLTGDAVLRRIESFTLVADAIVQKIIASTFTADAYLVNLVAGEGNFSADAVLRKATTGSLTADAALILRTSSTFTADAVLRTVALKSATADAILKVVSNSNFNANAVLRGSTAGTVDASAVVRRVEGFSLTANAVLRSTILSTFSANAVIRSSVSATFTADAYLFIPAVGQERVFTADAIIRSSGAGSFIANAILGQTLGAAFSADAHLLAVRTSSVTADAYIISVIASSFTADSIIRRASTTTFTADAAFVGLYGGPVDVDISVVPTIDIEADVVDTNINIDVIIVQSFIAIDVNIVESIIVIESSIDSAIAITGDVSTEV